MTAGPDPSPRRPSGTLALLVAVAVAGIVGGFLVGWFSRGDGGDAAVLPTVAAPAAPATTARTNTVDAPPSQSAPPARSAIAVAVLNATSITGFAAQTADRARRLGYRDPTSGNAPTQTGPTVVYFRPNRRAAAQRVATDLGFTAVRALPTSGPIAAAAPAEAQVVVVLGPG